jgi:poly(A) polymerase
MRNVVEPRVVPRAEHPISRSRIDPDALKVLHRLRQFNHTAYLVGGSVRDLLIGRRPKDFDIGTSAHPSQIKKLFRNCWIIGRRFRLAHVRFGSKIIEVATFRRQIASPEDTTPADDHPIHRDNTFGTPEEDAFRRDFTINALFYDIATFSVIDYVGGLDDLRAGIVRSIGDPVVRFREDPVRMMRAVALASRLDFTIDQLVLDAIHAHRGDISRSAPPRVLEEYYKILRAGSAQRTFRDLARLGLLEPIAPELHQGASPALWRSLEELDEYRRRFESSPDTLTNPVLLGSLLAPLGVLPHRGRPDDRRSDSAIGAPSKPAGPRLGALPLARRDVERLRQILDLQRRLRDVGASPRAKRALMRRSMFREAVTWLEIHGGAPDIVEHWKAWLATATAPSREGEVTAGAAFPSRRRRRRRRRFRHPPP